MFARAIASSSRPARQLVSRCLPVSPITSRFNSSASPTPQLTEGEQRIHDILKAKLAGKQLRVQDVSGGCGSFYAIEVSSPQFKGLSIVKQHKLVNDALKDEYEGLHGLQMKTIVEE